MPVETIPLSQLALTFIPVAVVIMLMWRWRIGAGKAVYAVARMLLQLLLIGYLLVFIFQSESGLLILAVLTIMLIAAGWVALNTVSLGRSRFFAPSVMAITIGGGLTLWLVTQGVLDLQPWYRPSYMIPLAGMIFANSMTSISIALERLHAEIGHGQDFSAARSAAFRAAMIPVINSLFAVGLVSLPGMMTGQILAGVEPVIAARYQIMVMCMIFGSSGLSTACFLWWVKPTQFPDSQSGGDAQSVKLSGAQVP